MSPQKPEDVGHSHERTTMPAELALGIIILDQVEDGKRVVDELTIADTLAAFRAAHGIQKPVSEVDERVAGPAARLALLAVFDNRRFK